MDQLATFCHAIPKVELHVHLLGAVRPDTFAEFARRQGAGFTPEEVADLYRRDARPKGVLHVLRALEQRILRGPEDLGRVAYEYCLAAAAQNVRHAEVFWNPTGTARDAGIPYAAGADAILAGFAAAEREAGITALLIPSIDREATPGEAVEMVEWMLAHRRDGIIGLGIDYRETDRPPEFFWKAYRMAQRGGFRLTAHAGEFGCGWENVETAVELLQVDRIDHGYTAIDNPAFAARCAERGLLFTVVPTNSYYLRTLDPARWAHDHPIRRMPGLGLRIHPNTDDPPLHRIDPAGCWRKMVEDFGFGADDLRGFMLNGIDGAFIPDDRRRALRTEFTAAFDRLRAQHLPEGAA